MKIRPGVWLRFASFTIIASTATAAGDGVVSPSATDWDALLLRRAVYEWAGAERLRAIALNDSMQEAGERGLSLRAGWHQREGDVEGFAAMLQQLLPLPAALRDPVLARGLLEDLDSGLSAALDAGDFAPQLRLLVAAHALEGDEVELAERMLASQSGLQQEPLHHWLRAELALRRGGDPSRSLEALIALDLPWLSDAARLQRATRALAEGEDPGEWLSAIEEPSLHTRARHLLAVRTEDPEALERLYAEDMEYSMRHDVASERAALALDAGEPELAQLWYEHADEAWQLRRAALQGHTKFGARRLRLAPDAGDAALSELLDRLMQLHAEPPAVIALEAPELEAPDADALPLAAEHADSLATLEAAEAAARWRSRMAKQRAREESEALARQQRYLDDGQARQGELEDEMARTRQELSLVVDALASIRRKLEHVHEVELRRVAERTARLIEQAERNQRGIRLLDQLYVRGPMQRYDRLLHEETPKPAEILGRDSALGRELSDFAARFAVEVPELLARSMREKLEPRLLGRGPELAAIADSLEADRRAVAARIDAAHDGASDSRTLRHWNAVAEAARRDAYELSQRRDALAVRAREAARERALLVHDADREGIDYGLAAATYEHGLALADAGDEESDRAKQLRALGIERLRHLIEIYPEAPFRAESRFRLADLLLADARDDFHHRMENYLRTRQGAVPVMEHEEPIALYRQILEEDAHWAHRDAARFALGMLLADLGDREASDQLAQLLRGHPESRFRQRAELRLADLLFAEQDFARARGHYAAAAEGDDPELVAIALYKLGWSHLNQEQQAEAVQAFTRLLDLYESGFETAQAVDLRKEAEEDLVQALARSGGAASFERHFDQVGERDYAPRILASMSGMLRRYSLYDEAIASDELYLDRYAERAQALDAAERLLDTHRRHSKKDVAEAMQLRLATRFQRDGAWAAAQSDEDALRRADAFARKGYREAALREHRAKSYTEARAHYETLLALWPEDGEAPRFSLLAGQCALESQEFQVALDHFTAAAQSDTASFRDDAAWQRVVSVDRWYESTRADGLGDPALATQLSTVAGEYLGDHSQSDRAPDLRWRIANLAFAHGRHAEAESALAAFANAHPRDERVWHAERLRGESLQRLQRFDAAAIAYQSALRRAPADEPARDELAKLVPHCHYKHAEASAAADSSGSAAALFAAVADGWPGFEHAGLARYRAGLSHLQGGDGTSAIAQWEQLLAEHPEHEMTPDAHRRIAAEWARLERWPEASRAYERINERYPEAEDATDALLLAMDHAKSAGDDARVRSLQDRYLERYPGDVEMAFLVREERAQAELAELGGGDVSALLAGGDLADYLQLAEKHPDQASNAILAQVRFAQAEDGRAVYESLPLTQPLEQSLVVKQKALEELLTAYGRCAELSESPWAQASAHRIGEALIHFGESLAKAPAPPELSGDDALAYREVLEEQSWTFLDRGEEAWTQLLRDAADLEAEGVESWIDATKERLYPRIARRFVHRVEVAVPLIRAEPAPSAEAR